MTVAENIGFTMKLRRRPKAEIAAKVGAVAELLELSPYLDRLPRELSGGQQQRVALGRAIIREPRVLFDEPFSNLDAALRLKMRAEIKLLHSRLGVTSIFVTHDQEEALSISDRIAVMRQGRVEQYGTPEEVYARPATTYVARFIGSPPMDILHERSSRRTARAFTAWDGRVPAPRADSQCPARGFVIARRRSRCPLRAHPARRAGDASPGDGAGGAAARAIDCRHRGLGWWRAHGAGTGHYRTAAGGDCGLRLDPAGLLFFDRETGLRLEA